MQEAIRQYLREVEREFTTGIAAEHAYRPALERLLEAIEDGLNAVNDPKRSDIGAPDFQVLRHGTTIGFVEAKDIGISLTRTERTEQLKRYTAGFENLILTDYLEFRWYVKGDPQHTVRIARTDGNRIHIIDDAIGDLIHLLNSFAQVVVPTINTARELAQRMAANAHLIRDLIFKDLGSSDPSANLVAQCEAFKKTLLPDIDNAQFADMYAQTIAYGLFAARINYDGNPASFSRRGASEDIPRTNPFLRKLFSTIGLDLGDRVTFLVDVLADLLARTDMDEILKDFGKATRQEDPVVHFYETFLKEYDPNLREQRGVYYTPEPVVSYIVRSVDHILKEKFGRRDGLADTNTLVLDPATGTGTFLYFVLRHIFDTGFAGQAGIWESYVRDHLLQRIFGFELLMAPYAVAHMKLGMLLDELGYEFDSDQRLGVYLTNTLEEAAKNSETLFAQFISEEADEAAAVKRDKPIMVVLGNPPYSYASANIGEWISNLVRNYYFVDGHSLGEHNPRGLQDDYVKFIRFGQWRIEQTGSGVLAFINNNGFLENVTFRGMRQQLMLTFTDIYVINLHGNSRIGETTPDGLPDENVFDIQAGVSINIFVKEANHNEDAKIHYADLWGRRTEKYQQLLECDFQTMEWEEVKPQTPFYFFIPQNIDLLTEYDKGWKITDISSVHSTGLYTARDDFAVQFSSEKVLETVRDFTLLDVETARHKYKLGNDSRDWQVKLAQQDINTTPISPDKVKALAYRPFDIRFTYYTGVSRGFICMPRLDLMHHMLSGKNLGLITSRLTKGETFQHVHVTENILEKIYLSSKTSNNAFLFPLYLYPEKKEGELFSLDDDGSAWPLSDKGRRPNLNPDFVKDMADKLGLEFVTDGKGDLQAKFGPEDIFAYAYAVFHNPTYRERYAEFLKNDFPRLPTTSDVELFRVLVSLGSELVDLHLMRSPVLAQLMTTYPVSGSNEVISRHPKYTEKDQRVWINAEQYFEGVPQDVWEFYVGGYQVLHKWLKDRRGHTLGYDDIRHYQRVVVILRETMRLMDEIDDVISGFPLE